MRKLMRETINWCRRSRGWTLYVDEFELLSSQRMMRLGDSIERMLITARRAGTSVMTAFQNPAWVSKHAIRQAGLSTVWQTGNQQLVKAVAEATGRDWKVLAAVMDELPKWHSVTIPKDMRRPMLVTKAPKI
jgi:DNA-binding IclR family transcriptional regulator